MSPVDLNALAERCARESWPQARAASVDLGFEPAPAPVLVEAHAGQLREALLNLLDNSLRYVPAGGQVTVQVFADSEGACVRVVDDGPGIPADERPRAGERFFRGSNVEQPGSGLGLAIVRAIMLRHRGSMDVSAAVLTPEGGAQGTAVSLRLPLLAPDSTPPAGGPLKAA